MATISRLLKITGLFGEIWSLLWGSFAKQTYHVKEPTDRSHPIAFNMADSTYNGLLPRHPSNRERHITLSRFDGGGKQHIVSGPSSIKSMCC